jgi:hypothetical protein
MVDLSRACDGCGVMVGGGVKYCPKCKIYFCDLCLYQLMGIQHSGCLLFHLVLPDDFDADPLQR